MKKITLIIALTLCVLLASGCSKKPGNDAESTNSHTFGEAVSAGNTETDVKKADFSDEAKASIAELRDEIEKSTTEFGIAYIGQFSLSVAKESEIDLNQWLEATASPFEAEYPFILEIDENHTVGTEGYLYCVIGGEDGDSISVSRIGDDKPLYTAKNGDPVLIFANVDGDSEKADTVVTIKTAQGEEYIYEPTLEGVLFPDILVGDERRLLSWDFTCVPGPEGDFDLEGWLKEGWGGPTALGLAYDSNGMDWWITTWDESESYCLSFYLNEGNGYDGNVVLECFYKGDSSVKAKWEGSWRIETEMDNPSRVYVDLRLTGGEDMASFSDLTDISESYRALIPQSGNNLLLVADTKNALLPAFPDGVQAIELDFAEG